MTYFEKTANDERVLLSGENSMSGHSAYNPISRPSNVFPRRCHIFTGQPITNNPSISLQNGSNYDNYYRIPYIFTFPMSSG